MAKFKFNPLRIASWLIPLLLLVVGYFAYQNNLIPGLRTQTSSISDAGLDELPSVPPPAFTSVPQLPMPGTVEVNIPGSVDDMIVEIMGWQSQTAFNYANGGPVTTEGSLMARRGVELVIRHQDDVEQMKRNLIALADAMDAGNDNPAQKTKFVAIMGDGSHAFLQTLNQALEDKGYPDDLRAEVVGSFGYSVGEDKCMGPQSWVSNPELMQGQAFIAYVLDGDWNLCLDFAFSNGIPVNPDTETYDPNALNVVPADDYIKASKMLIDRHCEDRDVIDSESGRRTGETHNLCPDAVGTWTPGDVMVAESPRGREQNIISLLSTRENRWQMPNTVIGIKRWNRNHQGAVSSMFAAAFEAADQFRSHKEVRDRAFKINTQVFVDANRDAEYWERYFDIQRVRYPSGAIVELGGSAVNGLADNLHLFGLGSYSTSIFEATYAKFGRYAHDQYPDEVGPVPDDLSEVFDPQYVLGAQALLEQEGSESSYTELPSLADFEEFGDTGEFDRQLRNIDVNVEFEFGQANPTSEGMVVLERLLQELVVTDQGIRLGCHTDTVGDATSNMALSQRRCDWVENWFTSQDPTNFPDNRITTRAYGETQPLVDGDTDEAHARNRRVQVVTGTTGG